MKKLAVLAIALSAAFSSHAAPVAVTIDAFEAEVLALVNAERSKENLSALSFDARLQASAEAHSLDMATNDCFQHNSCNGTDWDVRVRGYYPDGGFGENIAAGYTTPEAVVAVWMNSPGHRANILNSDYLGIGIGYSYQAGTTYGHYWTQDFGTLAAQPVPEPETYAMLLAGLGLLGAVARRRFN